MFGINRGLCVKAFVLTRDFSWGRYWNGFEKGMVCEREMERAISSKGRLAQCFRSLHGIMSVWSKASDVSKRKGKKRKVKIFEWQSEVFF